MRSEMKAYIYKIFILLTLRKSKCSQLHLWQVRFCFVLSSLHLYKHQFRACSFGFDQNCCCYTFSIPDTEVWVEFCFSGLPDITTTKVRQSFCDFLSKEEKKLLRELVLVSVKLNEQVHTRSPCSSLKMEMTSLKHVSHLRKWARMPAIKEKLETHFLKPTS